MVQAYPRAWRAMRMFLIGAGSLGSLLRLVASPSAVFAAGVPVQPPPANRAAALTAADAIREALAGNRDLRAATFAIAQARARLEQAGLWPNPSLQLAGADDVVFANEGDYDASIGFEQRFPVAGRLARGRDVARVDIAIAVAEVRDATRLLVAEVEISFSELLVLQEQIAARAQLIAVNRRLADVSAHRAALAEVSALDVNTAQLELHRLELERDLLTAQAQARSTELSRLLGRDADATVTVAGELVPGPPRSLAELRETALAWRPDLQQLRLAADRARAEQALAKAERWEDWALGFRYARTRQPVVGAPSQPSDQLLGLSVSIPLPLWNRNQGRIAEMQALEAQARSRAAALELTILADVESAHHRVEDLGAVTERYRTRVTPLTSENVRLAQEGYQHGLVPVTQVVQVQRQQSELRTAYLDALAQYRQAAIELETAAATSPLLAHPEEIR